jgi:predicted tellurium resistance membrane protein TerC
MADVAGVALVLASAFAAWGWWQPVCGVAADTLSALLWQGVAFGVNVLAIAAVAKDSTMLLMVGLAISIPLIVAGAAIIMRLLARFPVLVWAGAGLLGWVAGEMLITDPWLVKTLGAAMVHTLELPTAAVGAALTVGLGYILNRMAANHAVEREA